MPKVGFDSSGEPAGIFIDILEYIAGNENWELEYVEATWSELLQKLESGEIDLMVDVARSEEREKLYDFNQLGALSSWLQIYAKEDQTITGIQGLNGKTIGVLEGSVQHSYLEKLRDQLALDIRLITFDSYPETIEATEQGICDVLIACRFFAHQYNTTLKPASVFLRPSTLHYAVKKGTHEDVLAMIDYHMSVLMNKRVDVYQDILAQNLGGPHVISVPFYVFLTYFILGTLLIISVVIVVFLLLRLKHQSLKVLETERRLHHSDKLNAIGHLAGGVAHDFNNMLMGIKGYAEVIVMNTENRSIKEYAEKILEIGDHSGELIRQLLSFARQDRQEKTISDIHKMTEDIESLLKHSLPKSIRIDLDLKADRFQLLCLKSQIHSALLNLCINAGDAMPNGGILRISSSNLFLHSQDFESMRDYIYADQEKYDDGEYLVVSVKDTGHGIPEDKIEDIFTPYFTTKEAGEGTGLGMAAVLSTVSVHKGVLALRSTEKKGTEVRLYLPLPTGDMS